MIAVKEYPRVKIQQQAPPPSAGWTRQWHGLYTPPTYRFHSYGMLERYTFLSILEYYGGKHVNLFELGAGRADWCMALAGAVQYGLVPNPPASYRALAVEAEPTHFGWVKQVIEDQKMNAIPVYGAVSAADGEVNFMTSTDPMAHFGQCILSKHDARGTIVPCHTVDTLREKHGFETIEIVHMDVQGAEADCVRGAKKSLAEGRIAHFLIETHSNAVEGELKELLEPTHRLIVDLEKGGRLSLPEFSLPIIGKGGGIHLWQKKGL